MNETVGSDEDAATKGVFKLKHDIALRDPMTKEILVVF